MKKACMLFIPLMIIFGCAFPTPKPKYEAAPADIAGNFARDLEYSGSYSISMNIYDDVAFDVYQIVQSRVIECTNEIDSSKIVLKKEWYDKEPYDKALVHISVELEFNDPNDKDGLYQLDFYLVKENRDSEWDIVHFNSVENQ